MQGGGVAAYTACMLRRFASSTLLFLLLFTSADLVLVLQFAGSAQALENAAFSGGSVQTSPTYTAYVYNGCAGAGYDTYVQREKDGSGNYVYSLYLRWRGDYSGWFDTGLTGGITTTLTKGGKYGRDSVYVQLNVDGGSPDRSGAEIIISSCKGSLLLPAQGYYRGGYADRHIVFPADAPPAPALPTCSVTADDSTIEAGEQTVLRWTSANATSFHINSIGYVAPNASSSTQIGPLQTTNYDGVAIGPGGQVNCRETVTVTPPAPKICIHNCPTGYTFQTDKCVLTSCPQGSVIIGEQCVSTGGGCPTGHTLQGNRCVLTSCPPGFRVQNDQCVAASCPVAAGACEPGRACRNRNVVLQDRFCGYDAILEECAYGCANGLCLPPPEPDATLRATPSLVPRSDTATISWTSETSDSCTVSGSNGDGPWSGVNGSRDSSALIEATTYSLSCTGPGGTVSKSVTVGIVPVFLER